MQETNLGGLMPLIHVLCCLDTFRVKSGMLDVVVAVDATPCPRLLWRILL